MSQPDLATLQAEPPPAGRTRRRGRGAPCAAAGAARAIALACGIAAALPGCGGGGAVVAGPATGAPGADAARSAGQPLSEGGTVAFADDGVVGAPGETADCAALLPCRWVDADGAFAVTVSRIDNTARQGHLELHFEIDATHDTEPGIGAAGAAPDGAGRRVEAASATLEPVGPLVAGAPLAGRVEFAAPVHADTLADWSLTLSDNGTTRAASFAALPVGPVAAPPVDCANALPCAWTDPEALVTIELLAAGGFASERRLALELHVTPRLPLTLVAGPDTAATGTDGTVFLARQMRFAGDATEPGTALEAAPGAPLVARYDFFRVAGAPSALTEVTLDLYRDGPVRRWRPRFANVPALAP